MTTLTDLPLNTSAALDEEVARAELYGVLAALYYAPPTDEWLAQLRVAVTEAPMAGGFLQEPWQQLVGAARSLTAQQIADEYDALFALEHADEYARQAAVLRSERERLQAALSDMPGVQAWPSEANMVLVRVADSKAAFEGMKQRGVLIKHVAALHPLLANCLRLTVGTPEENTRMLDALRASV